MKLHRASRWNRAIRSAFFVAPALAVAVPTGVLAQAAADSKAVEVDKVLVTGSRIKRVDAEGPTPVATITRAQIDKLGYTNVKDILGNLTYNAGGSFDAGQSFSFARGTQSIDLRGFGAGRTLVLLDGRRLPSFPQGLGGTDAFVDLSSIPSSIVERIEVELDGASAIYGSDAISGVVNIITRKEIAGTELSARYLDSDDGGGETRRFTFAQGVQGADATFVIGGEYTDQNVLKFTDRNFSESDFGNGGRGSGFGNTFVADDGQLIADPSCGTSGDAIGGRGVPFADGFCRFDRSKFRQFIPDSEKGSLYLRSDRKFGDIDSYFRLGYTRTESSVQLEPNAYAGGESVPFTNNRIIPNSAFDPIFGPGYVAAGAPNNPTTGTGNESGGYFFRRLTEFGPRGSDLTIENFSGVIGLSGTIFSNYDWDLGFGHNEVRLKNVRPTILSSILDNEVSNNGLDLFQPIPAEILTKARHTQVETGASRNSTVDGTLTGPVGISLPGGPIQFSLHTDYENEEYKDEFDKISVNGDVFDGGNGGGGEREHVGFGLELSLPVTSQIELGLAGRYDDYKDSSDVNSAFSPNVRIGYRPFDIVLVRASYGESFRAPDLQRLFGATTNGFETVIDTPRCTAAGGTPGTPIDPTNPNDICLEIQSVPVLVGANGKLKEEEGENFNVGLVVEPLKNLNLRVDYYEIKVDDLVSELSAQQLLDICASSNSFCNQILRDPATGLLGTPSAGGSNAASISAGALNLATQESHGVDFGATYSFAITNIGKFNTDFSWSHLTSLKVRSLLDGPDVQQLGFGQTILAPKDRFSWTNDWALAQFGATIRVDRVGEYPGSNSLTEPARSNQFVDPYTTVNIQGRVDFGKWGLIRAGVDNVFDEDFPLDPTFAPGTPNVQNQFLGEATAFYANPLGRAGYLQYEIKF